MTRTDESELLFTNRLVVSQMAYFSRRKFTIHRRKSELTIT